MKTTHSRTLFERAMKVTVEGVGSSSRGPVSFAPSPPYMRHGRGARLWDVDGNEYIDWMLSFGALPMGHAHPKIVEVVRREVANGTHFATALEVEVEVAEMIVGLVDGIDKVRFANTGTEAVMAAVRLARGLTGRRKIIKFEGHYHGWYDSVLVSSNPQIPSSLGHPNDPVRIPDSSGLTPGSWEDTYVVPWNNFDALERAMDAHGRDAACVVTEGVMSNMGVIPPKPGFLERVQTLCHACGALFYLDETVTGFRLAAGGCAELYGLTPDIRTYGKALGQGFPVAAIAGPAPIMEGLEWGKVLHYGSHNAPRLGLFATKAMLEEMTANGNEGFNRLQMIGNCMAEKIREAGRQSNKHPMIVQNVGSMFQIFFTDQERIDDYRAFCRHVDRAKYNRFINRLIGRGVWMTGANTLHSLSCTAHTDADMEATVAAIGDTLDELD